MIAEEISPEGAPPFDLPSQPAVFAPGPDPEMLAEVSAKLRKAAGLPAKPTGVVANNGSATAKASSTRSRTPSARSAVPAVAPRDAGRHQPITATPANTPNSEMQWQN